MWKSRRELSNEYLPVIIGFDTAENEPCKVCPLSAYRSLLLSLQIPQVKNPAATWTEGHDEQRFAPREEEVDPSLETTERLDYRALLEIAWEKQPEFYDALFPPDAVRSVESV